LSIRPLDRFEVYAFLALRAVPQPFATAVAFSSQLVMTLAHAGAAGDRIVGEREQRRRHRAAKCFCRRQIDGEFKPCRQFNRQITGFASRST
jgi:hypothetical protein